MVLSFVVEQTIKIILRGKNRTSGLRDKLQDGISYLQCLVKLPDDDQQVPDFVLFLLMCRD